MANTFFAADHHFGHQKVLTFTNPDGTTLRNFRSVEEMNRHMVQQHNAVVKPGDTVYFLGDVTLSRNESDLLVLDQLHGNKRLVLGNHDIQPPEVYKQYFKRVYAIHALEGMVLTHVPIHPCSLSRWGANVHGHLHNHTVGDSRYYCVSVERLDDYKPISLGVLRSKLSQVA